MNIYKAMEVQLLEKDCKILQAAEK